MKESFIKYSIVGGIVFSVLLVIFDYINLPSYLGFQITNINWNLGMIIVNNIVVISIYILTYKTLNKRTVEREKNKRDISNLLIKNCYEECDEYVKMLDQETIEKYIIPKLDFNSTEHELINNFQQGPFKNESVIMELVKDGQIGKLEIEQYFKVKKIFSQYVMMRIVFFDKSEIYCAMKQQLGKEIDRGIQKITGSEIFN